MKFSKLEMIILPAAIVIEAWTIAAGHFSPTWDIPLLFLIAFILVKKYKASRENKK